MAPVQGQSVNRHAITPQLLPARKHMSAVSFLAEVRKVAEQLEPDRARNAITMASVMIDEIRLRASARPLDGHDAT